jgi:cell wall-associated NlpC family hydrolase
MTAATNTTLALMRSTLPVKRVASPGPVAPGFAALLKAATLKQKAAAAVPAKAVYHGAMLPAAPAHGGITRSQILQNADQLMGIPYVWGGTANSGLDCSAFVSKVWGVSRHTTDTLSAIAHPIAKDELQAGDALNLTTGADPEGDGHVRLFDRWADAAHTKMYVYEETPPKSVHHVINWDPKYQPMRLNTVTDG